MENKHIQITFPNGEKKSYPLGVSLEQIAGSISSSLRKKSVTGRVNGELFDYQRPILHDASIELCDLQSDVGLEVLRHSMAHILAQAVKRIYHNSRVHLGVGPVVEHGFYYDMDLSVSIGEEDLSLIEKEMNNIVSENLPIEREEVSRVEAEQIFKEDPLKLELLKDIPVEDQVTIYRQGEFIDLCKGPHLPSTKYAKAFSLRNVAGAYWKGDNRNRMLQRIYGVAFASKDDVKQYQAFLEDAERRNHRTLGKDLELFMFSEEAPGMPFFLANGQIIRNELEVFLRGLQQAYDYSEVRTPIMMNQRLWEQSGHWDHYKDNMYFSDVDEQRFALKPMNCPGHMLIYKHQLRSYRDLPIRMAEFGQVHRHEFSGSLNGMLRVRTFCQDDAHIFVREDQIEAEVKHALQLIDNVYQTFGFSYRIELSTRPEDSMGDDALWEKAEGALRNVLHSLHYNYSVNKGDGAFYGPKIDIHINDALNRSHQCATVQLDFQMPEKFDLQFVDQHNCKKRPVVIHRAVFGSIDRFLGILIEHFGGAFPVWLAPVQIKVLPVSSSHHAYAEHILQQLKRDGVRVEVDDRQEKLGYRIREAQVKKTPYIVVVGDEEQQQATVSVRKYGEDDLNKMELDNFISSINQMIRDKK
ncbi:threonine--tRNA ligase [Pontibacillus salicampi]|uniref:Threonine--tRNA ligase n=1 Tax=Pontibacillus salicampi TaxID=1449801 RepID=A0ABV6LKG5_9BACI